LICSAITQALGLTAPTRSLQNQAIALKTLSGSMSAMAIFRKQLSTRPGLSPIGNEINGYRVGNIIPVYVNETSVLGDPVAPRMLTLILVVFRDMELASRRV